MDEWMEMMINQYLMKLDEVKKTHRHRQILSFLSCTLFAPHGWYFPGFLYFLAWLVVFSFTIVWE